MSKQNWQFETLQLYVGQEEADKSTGARAVPIYQTTSYVFDNCEKATNRFNLSDTGLLFHLSMPFYYYKD